MNWKDILIIVVLVSVVGGLFAYEYWWGPKEETEGPELPKIAEEEKEELVSPKLENEWQAFGIEKYGLFMKIPAGYKKEDFVELDPKESKILLVARFAKNDNEDFTLSIDNEGEKDAKEAKETYQLEFEQQESLKGMHLFPEAKLTSIQKLEKKGCPIFIFSLSKDDQTFNKLVFIFPTYREELVFKMTFDYPSKGKEEKVSEMINSIECSSPIETSEWCPIGTYANFGGSDQYKIIGIERHKVAGKYMDLCCGERTATGGVGKGKKCIDMPTGDYNYLIMWVASERTNWQYEKLTEVYPKDGQRCMISFESGKEIGTVCLPKE